MGENNQEQNRKYQRENKFLFFIKSNRFHCLISFIIALSISCVLVLVVAYRYIIVTTITGIVIISSMAIVLSFFIYVPIRYLRKKN